MIVEERPDLRVYGYRKAPGGAPIEMVIVIDEKTYVIPLSDRVALQHAADLTGFLASRP
jgi:hypothetical protein